MPQSYVYILASKPHGVLYVGVSTRLPQRIAEHKHPSYSGFTQRYNVHLLVYYEVHEDIYQAITREKQLKKWRRAWKIKLIEKHNSSWRDLYLEL